MENKNIDLYGKISQFPKNTEASKAYNFLENVKICKKKLWYFIIEKDIVETEDGLKELQLIKYNNKQGVNCVDFVNALKEYYKKDDELRPIIEKLKISGKSEFSTITNIPDVEINGKKVISIITQDLIKLLK
jgi:hypothetical protein